MQTDIRLPIGGMFSIIGLVLAIYGLLTHGNPMYARSLGINVNVWWGLVMLAFGVAMLFGAIRAGRRTRPDPQGQSQNPS